MPELSDRIKRGQSNNGALYFLCFDLSKNAMTSNMRVFQHVITYTS